ncbi:GNAT family N-acetyltransferase [Streptomyces sp. HB132]|uniref:GNAT family N-acetyltransferase n=1 Tax=Streptomyces sp. HB132 TaxID=767388 RepID=UPI00196112D0|nr:GNAT family N-acetyltransferase [Streptomyces sp. HB132]MBM7436636.1 RimJ/RimL family protein N-acetyltransferase [Streptomyces sp. HB132]
MEEPPALLRHGRVELRRWHPSDLDALHEAISDSLDHLMPWMPWAATHDRRQGAAFLARNQEEWVSGETFGYAITSNSTVIGSCGLHRRIGAGGLEIGYWLRPRWTGRGHATAAATALVDQGFRLTGIDRLEIHHDAANPASGAVARRMGFTEAGRGPAPDGPAAPGELGITVVWRVTADQWKAGASARADR